MKDELTFSSPYPLEQKVTFLSNLAVILLNKMPKKKVFVSIAEAEELRLNKMVMITEATMDGFWVYLTTERIP